MAGGARQGIAINIQARSTQVIRIAGTFKIQGDTGQAASPFGLGFWSDAGDRHQFHGILVRPSDGSLQLVKQAGPDQPVVEASAPNVDSLPSHYPAAKWHGAGEHSLMYNVNVLTGQLIGSVTLDSYTYSLESPHGSWTAAELAHAGASIAEGGKGTATLLGFKVSAFAQSVAPAHFVHPGLLSSKEDLDPIRAELKDHKEPWTSGLGQLEASPFAQSSYKMAGPFATVTRDKGPSPHRAEYERDVIAAYQNALLWAITGDRAHAAKANEILSAYAHTLEGLNGSDVQLLASLAGHLFVNAAEIMRHTNSGWNEGDAKLFGEMMMTKYYPLIC